MAQHFDLAALELVVGGAGGTRTHHALDLHAELVAHVFGHLEHLGAVGVADHLHIAFAVAQVDEDHATMVTAAVHPAAQGHGFAHLGFGHQTAVLRTHCHENSSCTLGVRQGCLFGFFDQGEVWRSHHAHRNNVFERRIHTHFQLDAFALAH